MTKRIIGKRYVKKDVDKIHAAQPTHSRSELQRIAHIMRYHMRTYRSSKAYAAHAAAAAAAGRMDAARTAYSTAAKDAAFARVHAAAAKPGRNAAVAAAMARVHAADAAAARRTYDAAAKDLQQFARRAAACMLKKLDGVKNESESKAIHGLRIDLQRDAAVFAAAAAGSVPPHSSVSDATDFVQDAALAIMTESEKAKARSACDASGAWMHSEYTYTAPNKHIIAQGIDENTTIPYCDYSTVPVKEVYRTVSRSIDNSRSVKAASDRYTYIEDMQETGVYYRQLAYTMACADGTTDENTVEAIRRYTQMLKLTDKELQLLENRMKGYGYNTISRITGIGESTLKMRAQRLRKKASKAFLQALENAKAAHAAAKAAHDAAGTDATAAALAKSAYDLENAEIMAKVVVLDDKAFTQPQQPAKDAAAADHAQQPATDATAAAVAAAAAEIAAARKGMQAAAAAHDAAAHDAAAAKIAAARRTYAAAADAARTAYAQQPAKDHAQQPEKVYTVYAVAQQQPARIAYKLDMQPPAVLGDMCDKCRIKSAAARRRTAAENAAAAAAADLEKAYAAAAAAKKAHIYAKFNRTVAAAAITAAMVAVHAENVAAAKDAAARTAAAADAARTAYTAAAKPPLAKIAAMPQPPRVATVTIGKYGNIAAAADAARTAAAAPDIFRACIA